MVFEHFLANPLLRLVTENGVCPEMPFTVKTLVFRDLGVPKVVKSGHPFLAILGPLLRPLASEPRV